MYICKYIYIYIDNALWSKMSTPIGPKTNIERKGREFCPTFCSTGAPCPMTIATLLRSIS